jgi:acetyl-CoA synthetase
MDDGSTTIWSYRDLERRSRLAAWRLRALGLEPGDRILTWSPSTPDLPAVYFGAMRARLIIVPLDLRMSPDAVEGIVRASGARHLVLGTGRDAPDPREAGLDRFPTTAVEAIDAEPDETFPSDWEAQLDAWPKPAAEEIFELVYTSGTTGTPKGVLHVQGGFLVSIAREVCYQADARPGDVLHFATDMGWIMGPWTVVGGGAMGATIVYSEGAPDWPQDRLWRMVEEERVSILGCSPTLVRALMPAGDPTGDLSSLRIFVTTGEPWNPAPYRWLFEHVGGSRCPIINCSGGTEVGACFLSPTPVVPIKECSLGGPALGMAMDVVDDDGNSLVGSGEVGELVCRKPFPGMTRGFWRDDERYLETYWRRFPGVWTHGDWASVDEDGYWFLHGRSDDTLNIAGKRIGPAELESAAVAHPAVVEAAAVGIPHDVKGEVAWVFCVAAPGTRGCESLALEVRSAIASELGKAFAPERVVFVPALPKTRSAKIVRRAVRATALGEDPGDMSSVENPEALAGIASQL